MTGLGTGHTNLTLESVVGRMERLPFSRLHKRVFSLTAAGYMFDAFDIGLLSFIMPALAADLHLTPAQIGLVFTTTFLGMFLGAMISGQIADRFGRLKVFQYTLLIFAFGTAATGLIHSFGALLVLRFITGLGLGGEQPVAFTYVSEMVPHEYRGRLAGWTQSAWGFGMMLAGAVALFFVPTFGWQSAFFVGIVPAGLVWFFRLGIPESPRWFMIRNEPARAETQLRLMEDEVEKELGHSLPEAQPILPIEVARGTKLLVLFRPAFRKRTMMLWLLWLFSMFGFWGVEAWMPTLLKQAGYSLTASMGYFFVMNTVRVPSGLFGAYLSDKVGRKKPILYYWVFAAIATLLFGWALSHELPPTVVLAAGIAIFLFMSGGQPVMYAYTPENYPTEVRGTGTGMANCCGRIGAMLAPAFVGFLYPVAGLFVTLAVIAGGFLVAALAVTLLGTETGGKTLEAISNVRENAEVSVPERARVPAE